MTFQKLSDRFKRYHTETRAMAPLELLAFILEQHRDKVAFSTSMGAEDQVIFQMLASLARPVRIFTLDTGRLFQETYELMDITQEKYGMEIEVYFPEAQQVERMVHEQGINLFYKSVENRKLCCRVRKTEPLTRALEGMEIWITGLRREQSVTRVDTGAVEWDPSLSLIKVNPLIGWTHDEVWQYIREHRIPYNTLHDKGFPSIGCLPCTRAVLPGEDIRAGRWWWENPEWKECGLHINKK